MKTIPFVINRHELHTGLRNFGYTDGNLYAAEGAITMVQDSSNQHSQYPDFWRHWCDTSEEFAGGDALLTAMQNHWVADETCYEQQYWQAGTRLVTIYHFNLTNGDEQMAMPVLGNPFVRRIIREEQFKVKPFEQMPTTERENRYEGKA
jgi:hypothetical protein